MRSTSPLLAALFIASLARSQALELVSLSASGTPAHGNSGLGQNIAPPNGARWQGVSGSSDGRFIAFYSEALDLVPGVAFAGQIYVRDRHAGTTALATARPDGAAAAIGGTFPELSERGRYLAFASSSPDLVPGDTNAAYDVFVRDLVLGATECVSVDSSGSPGNANSGFYISVPWESTPALPLGLSISADGRYVAFSSAATNLVPGDANQRPDVFVRDRVLQTTRRISIEINASDPPSPLRGSSEPRISADGRRVAFTSTVRSLVLGDTNGRADVFVTDLAEGWTVLASRSSTGEQALAASYAPKLSADGRCVAFMSSSTNLGSTSSTGPHVFVHDLRAGTTSIECIAPGANSANGFSELCDLSSDGRFVLFANVGSDLVLGDTNQEVDLFRRDRVLGSFERVSVGAGGVEADGETSLGRFLGSSSAVVFASAASTLVAGDTNGARDVFVGP